MSEQWIHKTLRNFRVERMRRFEREFRVTGRTRILDIGGTPLNWSLLTCRPQVTILNLPRAQETLGRPNLSFVAGDGCRLPFAAGSFDIAFANSVIEHVGGAAAQQAFAREVARVAPRYYVQTPNRSFPVEQHLLTPFLHYLPGSWQRAIAPRFTVWALIVRPSPDRRDYYLHHILDEVRLLDAASMRALFPGAAIATERFLGLPKSVIAIRR